MAIDFDTNEDGQIHPDEFGDFATVQGNENVKAQIRNATNLALKNVEKTPLTDESKREIRRSLKQELSSLSYVDEIISVSIYKSNGETLTVKIQTKSDDIVMGI